MMTMKLATIAAITCGLAVTGGLAYQSIARTTHSASGPKIIKNVAAVPHPDMVSVSVTYIDAAQVDLDAASKQIIAGTKHDAQLMQALIKAGAETTRGPREMAENDTMGRTVGMFQVPMSVISLGNSGKGSMIFGMITDAKPHINPDHSITVDLNLQTNVPNPDPKDGAVAAPPAFVKRTIKMTRTFLDGETAVVDATTPTRDDPLVHLAFVNVASVPINIPSEFADIPGAPLDPDHLDVARSMESTGAMSQRDYFRITGIESLSRPNRELTDEQYDTLFSILKKPTKWPGIVEARIFGIIMDLPKIPENRKEQLYQIALPYLTSTDVNSGTTCRIYAAHIMAKLGEKRAIPLIIPRLNDPDANTREKAAEDLKKLGYVAPASAAGVK